MKKLYLVTLLVILISSIIHSQWTNQNPVPDGNDLWSTFFIDDTGWIVGSGGFIKKTTNAGLDWIQQNSGTTLTLKSIQFVNINTGWICGEGGLILKTTDGGLNWFSLTSGTNEHLTDIHFYDIDIGYVVGYGGTILKTTDGGSVWMSQSSGTSYELTSVDFVDALLGYAAGYEIGNFIILKTTDGGLNWFEKQHPSASGNNSLNTIEFIDANTGWIGIGDDAMNTGSIYKTTDGGDTWTQQYYGYELKGSFDHKENYALYDGNGIRSIFFKDSNNGYAVSGTIGWARTIITTTNGGSTWTEKYYGWESDGLLSVYVNSIGKGWAVGIAGSIFITENDGNSWVQILSGSRSTIWSGDDIYSVFFINENVGWALGQRESGGSSGEVILKTTNGGKIWETKFFLGNGGLLSRGSVYFINEYFGWIVCNGGGLCRTMDGGENWIWVSSIYDCSSVFFINQDTGWVAKETYNIYDDAIFKTTDGGITWAGKSNKSSSSVFFSDINNGWAVGPGGNILKSTDGGEAWLTKTSGTTNDLNYVRFFDSNLGMCVGNAGTVLLSTDGGENWISQNVSTSEKLTAVEFTNSTTIWITGHNGTILNTTDLGNNWTNYEEVTSNDLTSLSFLNENTGWIGGENGTMFKYQNDYVPVELVSFTACIKNNTVQLNWQTATEINNNGFEILRQAQDDRWDPLGFVKGQGNSSSSKSYSFTDNSPFGGSKIKYRLKQIDTDGKYEYSNEIEVEIIPTKFAVYQNYPNPFNPTTKIRYQVPRETNVVIKIYDILGSEVLTLLNEKKEPGIYEVKLNGISLASGTYIYRIIASDLSTGSGQDFVETKKMVLMK